MSSMWKPRTATAIPCCGGCERLISLRKRFKAFSRGTLTFLHPENQAILAFVRSHEDQNLLVVANLSRFVQFVELDLSAFAKTTPVEMFGMTEFPSIDKSPYPLTIGPHSFYWFYLQPASVRPEADRTIPETAGEPPLFECMASWHEVLAEHAKPRFEKVLSAYVRSKRWFGGKARQIKQARIQEWFPLPDDRQDTVFLFLQVDYVGSESETYVLPLIYVPARLALELISRAARSRCRPDQIPFKKRKKGSCWMRRPKWASATTC